MFKTKIDFVLFAEQLKNWGLRYRSSNLKQEYVQWNLSVTTTSIIKVIACDLVSNVF